MPGMPASIGETWAFGAPPNAVDAPENSLASDTTWACTSSPTTTSHGPVAPWIRFSVRRASLIVPPPRQDRAASP